MAAAGGRNRASLKEQLFEEPHRFDFFQAVRLLERIADRETPGKTSGEPVGHDYAPSREAVRFRAHPSHAFPAGAISRIGERVAGEDDSEGPLAELTVSFLGLVGPSGVLPPHYTTLLIERIRNRDIALRDFLDLFHHRTISLFYRAWEKYRFCTAYERAALAEDDDREDLFTRCLFCLVGAGTHGLRKRMEYDDEAILFYAGQFSRQLPSAVSLEQILSDYFAMPVEVCQFQGQWLYLEREDQTAFPSAAAPRGLNNALGVSALVGERVWDVESRFRMRMGPLRLAEFRRFVPGGDALRPLCQLIRSYVGPQFDFDVQPVLEGAETPWCVLGRDDADAPRLGWNTWIRCKPFDRDVADAVFSLEGEPWITKS